MKFKQPILVINSGENSPPRGEHNYIRKLLRMQQEGLLSASGLCELDVHHDEGCGVFRGGCCDCDPVIRPRAKPV